MFWQVLEIVSRPVWLEPCEPGGKRVSSKEAWRADHAGFVSHGVHFGFYSAGDVKLTGFWAWSYMIRFALCEVILAVGWRPWCISLEAWRPGRGLSHLYGQEMISGLNQGGSSEMVRVVVRRHFKCRTNRICFFQLDCLNRLDVRCERKRSQGKLKDFLVWAVGSMEFIMNEGLCGQPWVFRKVIVCFLYIV